MSEAAETGLEKAPEPSAAAVDNRLGSRVAGLLCPSCSGPLEIEVGLRVVDCPYCDTPLLATHEVGARRFAVEPRVTATEAREQAGKWLKSGLAKDRRLRREAKVGEAFLCFLPFYRMQADCLGFALGTEKRRRTVGSGKRRRVETYEVDVERSVEKSFDQTYPALNMAEWGLRRVDLRGDPLVPFEARSLSRLGMVFPPAGSEVRVRERALEQFRGASDPAAGLHRVRFRFLETLRERLSVVYYPLWVVRYRFAGRSYQVLVDGEDGSLAYGKAPGNDLYRALLLVATQAVALFLGTTLLQLWGGGFGPLAFVGIPVLAALAWSWRKFRYGGVVIEGSGVRAAPGFSDTVRSLSDRRSRRELLQELTAGRQEAEE